MSLETLFGFYWDGSGGFLIFLLQASFFADWLILALFFLQRLKLRPASLFCALAALLRLLLPLPLQSPFSLHRLWMGMPKQAVTVIEFSEEHAAFSGSAKSAGSLPGFLLLLWAAGVLWVLALFAVRLFRQRRRLQLSIPLPASSPAAAAVRDAAAGRRVLVYTCENIPAPLAVGVFYPRILIPSGTAFTDELRLALVHETAHIRRRHNLLKLLMLLACCLHWFNPLCWRLKRALSEELELSCDRQALRSLGEDARVPYARALLHFYAREPAPGLSSSFGGGAAEERIRQIMTYRPRRCQVLSAFLLVLLLFSALASLPAATLYSVTVSTGSVSGAGGAHLNGDALVMEIREAASPAQQTQRLTAVDEALFYGDYIVTADTEAQDLREGAADSLLLKFLFPFSVQSSRAAAVQQEETAAEENLGIYLAQETAEMIG